MWSYQTFTSTHFPYIPVTVILNKRTETVEALLDTGFDGDLIIPEGLMTNGKPPDSYLRLTLADHVTSVLAPAYLGRVEVAKLGDMGEHAAIISVLNRATQHWYTGSARKRVIAVYPRHQVSECHVE